MVEVLARIHEERSGACRMLLAVFSIRRRLLRDVLNPNAECDRLPLVAIDSTARKGIGTTVARRRFQRGTVYLNKTKTQWLGAYFEYALDAHGVERRKRVRIVLSPARKDDGTPVRKSETKNLLQPYLNRVNEQSTFPARERKTATFEAFAGIWESDYLILSKSSRSDRYSIDYLVAGACNAPNLLSLPFALNIMRLAA